MQFLKYVFVALVVFGLAACGSPTPPDSPPSDIESFPPLSESGYTDIVLTGDFPMALPELRAWLEEDNRMMMNLESTETVARPRKADVLAGEWAEVGAVRRLTLEDGHFVLERVLRNDPSRYEYQVWAFTNAAGRSVDHIHGIQSFTPLPDGGTRLEWTYALKPNAGFKRPFVRRFAEREIRPFLQSAITASVAQAREAVQ